MKIIKRGEIPEERVFRFECQHCHTVAEATAKEGRFSSDQRDGDARVFKCPVCDRDVWVMA